MSRNVAARPSSRRPPFGPHESVKTIYWRDSREMHRDMHELRGFLRGLLLELLDGPLTRHELRDALHDMHRRMRFGGRPKSQVLLEKELEKAQQLGILEERQRAYSLTPKGRELAEHIHEMIPRFFEWILSLRTIAKASIVVHVVLSIAKLSVGFLSGSAGLIADGIDNTVDTVSSVLVWLGLRLNREKLVAVFILLTMLISIAGVGITAYDKIGHPRPITEGLAAFALSLGFGLVMLGLSAWQYVVGTSHNSLAVLGQSVDSRNHFWTSLLVCTGILLSVAAETWDAPWLHYVDGVACIMIGLLIMRGALELGREIARSGDGEVTVSHFMKSTLERNADKMLFSWLKAQLVRGGLSKTELVQRFEDDFCKPPPKILTLSGMGLPLQTPADFDRHLEKLISRGKLVADEENIWIASA